MIEPKILRVDKSELMRRQQAVLSAMEDEKIDCIVLHNNGGGNAFGGMLRYLTDISDVYPVAALLFNDGVIIFENGVETDGLPEHFVPTGCSLPMSRWTFPGVSNTTFLTNAVPEAMAGYIRKNGFKKVGWAGMQFIPASIYKYLLDSLDDVEFIDFTHQVDIIRRQKSLYEIDRHLDTVKLHDRLVEETAERIGTNTSPHKLSIDIVESAARQGAIEFCTSLIKIIRDGRCIGPDSEELFQSGDYIWQLIEIAGRGGEWAECARIYRLNEEPDAEWVKASNDVVYIQDQLAGACIPGTPAQVIFYLGNRILKEMGYGQDTRVFVHGQSYDMIDLPMCLKGETSPLMYHEFVAIHPILSPDFYTITHAHADNYLIEQDGGKRVSNAPRKIITVSG